MSTILIFFLFRESVNVIGSQAAIYKCQTAVKVVVSILQKWEIYREEFVDAEDNLLKSLLQSVVEILANGMIYSSFIYNLDLGLTTHRCHKGHVNNVCCTS